MSRIQTAGKARRSQTASMYGIGSIIDLPTGSYIPLGLDWIEQQSGPKLRDFMLSEQRLESILSKTRFYSAPVPDQSQVSDFGQKVESQYTLPVIRFPKWLECPICHRLGTVGDPFEQDANYIVKCTKCNHEVNPVRFIIACRRGHVHDFPWSKWAHNEMKEKECANPVIRLLSHGKSSSLADLYLKCDRCKMEGSLASIFDKSKFKFPCPGERPWLLDNEPCKLNGEVIQRGGSNVLFPVITSTISIPPDSDPLSIILKKYLLAFEAQTEPDSRDQIIKSIINGEGLNVSLAEAKLIIDRLLNPDVIRKEEPVARIKEYFALSKTHKPIRVGNLIPDFENKIFDPPKNIEKWIDLISVITRLREVKAYCGFTRIEPHAIAVEEISNAIRRGRISPIAKANKNWLPATEVHGEGIFIRLRNETVKEWEHIINNPAVIQRAKVIDTIFIKNLDKIGDSVPYHITPRLLLVHSFAHILIRELSLECGYSSSSLSERLYISENEEYPMCGVLIYTSSSDSDGSLGGLANLGTPDHIEHSIKNALRRAEWCGSDPVCIENTPEMAGERFSGSSCHSCLLLPETACEKYNRELDRTMLIGFSDQKIIGFFEGLIDR